MSHIRDSKCPYMALHVVFCILEALRNDDVIVKSWRNHDLMFIVTHIIWIIMVRHLSRRISIRFLPLWVILSITQRWRKDYLIVKSLRYCYAIAIVTYIVWLMWYWFAYAIFCNLFERFVRRYRCTRPHIICIFWILMIQKRK